MIKQVLLVGLGGFIGSVSRYLISTIAFAWDMTRFPIGTFSVNILGSLLIGFLVGILPTNTLLGEQLKLFLIIGFCGGFTTFSTFSNENFILFQNGQYLTLTLYLVLSVALGILAVVGGYALAKLF